MWLFNTPKFISPLSKTNPENPQTVERFQPIIAGSELGNGFSELNDPIDQLNRFIEQQQMRDAGDEEAMMLDIDFVEMLEYGMPPTSGLGIGMDRLMMFLTDNQSIQEVLFFPQMRPEKKAPSIELGDDEKAILSLLSDEAKLLQEVKDKSQLSGKKWDKATKNLSKHNLIKVEKIDDHLIIRLA